MSMQKLRLVGCERFNFKGELYEKGKVYMVGDVKATIMLRKEDDYGRPYFVPYVAPAKTRTDRIAEAAAAAAIKAAKEAAAVEEEIVVRPDGSEVVEEVVEEDPEAAVEVEIDKDDDPELDEEDPENSEEVDEDEDRRDGTEVEV
jgi:hypothetical protein